MPAKSKVKLSQMTSLARKGLAIRRRVLGEENVDRWMAEIGDDPFIMKFFDVTHEFCWGTIWARTGLDDRTRSMLCLAMMGAMGLAGGVKRHIRSALRAGLTRDEIAETFLMVYCYAGVYKSVACFQAAKEAFAEIEAEEAAQRARNPGHRRRAK